MKLMSNVGFDGIEMRFDKPDYYYTQVFELVEVSDCEQYFFLINNFPYKFS